jgi:hypothetical protein
MGSEIAKSQHTKRFAICSLNVQSGSRLSLTIYSDAAQVCRMGYPQDKLLFHNHFNYLKAMNRLAKLQLLVLHFQELPNRVLVDQLEQVWHVCVLFSVFRG